MLAIGIVVDDAIVVVEGVAQHVERGEKPKEASIQAMKSLFGPKAKISATERKFNFRYRSAAHFIDVFRTWYGPVHKAFAALPPDKAAEMNRELSELLTSRNIAGLESLVVPSEYLEVVITLP